MIDQGSRFQVLPVLSVFPVKRGKSGLRVQEKRSKKRKRGKEE
jgi:hypothetical protein